MPLETKQCPNCGSSDVVDAAGQLVCAFCGSRLRIAVDGGASGEPGRDTQIIARRAAIDHLCERREQLRELAEHLRNPSGRQPHLEAYRLLPEPEREKLRALGARVTALGEGLGYLEFEAQSRVRAAEWKVLRFERQHARQGVFPKDRGRWVLLWAMGAPFLAVALLLAGLGPGGALIGCGLTLLAVLAALAAGPVGRRLRLTQLRRRAASSRSRVSGEYGPRLEQERQQLAAAQRQQRAAADEALRWVTTALAETEARLDRLKADMDRLAAEL